MDDGIDSGLNIMLNSLVRYWAKDMFGSVYSCVMLVF